MTSVLKFAISPADLVTSPLMDVTSFLRVALVFRIEVIFSLTGPSLFVSKSSTASSLMLMMMRLLFVWV